jgi:hypothetical protein
MHEIRVDWNIRDLQGRKEKERDRRKREKRKIEKIGGKKRRVFARC